MSQPNRSEEWQRKRREILRASAKIFYDKGFSQGTTRDIANSLGLTQPALYYYVGSKDDLISEIALEVDHEFTRLVTEAIKANDDPRERLAAVIHAFVAAMVDHQMGFGLRFTELRSMRYPVAEEIAKDERRFVELIEGAVVDAIEAGALPADRDARTVTMGVIGMMSWTFWWFDRDRHDPADIAETFCAMLGLPAAPVVEPPSKPKPKPKPKRGRSAT